MSESRPEKASNNPISQLSTYMTEVRGEWRKITWPTRPESIRLTGIVLAATAVMTVFLSSFDWVFSQGMGALVNAVLGIQ